MKKTLQKIQSAVRDLPLAEGRNETDVPFVTAWRCTGKEIPMPDGENPYIYIVLDGLLRLYTPSGIMDYMAGQYSISKIDTPLAGTVLAFSDRRDFLALCVEFTASDAISTVLDLDNDLTERIANGDMQQQAMLAADAAVSASVYRLLCAMRQAVRSEFLRRNILREIIYYVLCGSCGRQLLQSVANIGPVEEIYEANRWIKENFRDSFTVEALAERKNMSVSQFHQKFKSVVGMGPLQCQKRLRLTEARRLMLEEDKNVTQASIEVGYESLSQFIRDYRRMFGTAPKEDILGIQRRLQECAGFLEKQASGAGDASDIL